MSREADEALVTRLMSRDDDALAKVMELYGGIVNGMARRIVADGGLAEDVAQDVFVALWRRPGAFDPERGALKTFLATLARNKAVDLVRREESARRTKESLVAEFPTSMPSDEFADEVGNRGELENVLGRLSDAQREAIALAYFGGRTYREVAAELGLPEGTTKTRIRDGLINLRVALTQAREDSEDE